MAPTCPWPCFTSTSNRCSMTPVTPVKSDAAITQGVHDRPRVQKRRSMGASFTALAPALCAPFGKPTPVRQLEEPSSVPQLLPPDAQLALGFRPKTCTSIMQKRGGTH